MYDDEEYTDYGSLVKTKATPSNTEKHMKDVMEKINPYIYENLKNIWYQSSR